MSENQNQTFSSPDVDWERLEQAAAGFGEGYTRAEQAEMLSLYDEAMGSVNENEVVEGRIMGVTDREVIVDVGFKSDGLIPISEFRDLEEIKVGDIVHVYIERQEDANGQILLSRRKAKAVKAWEHIDKAYKEDLILEGIIKRRTKGGLIADVHGIEAFLPGSQIDVKPIRDFDIFVGKKMELKVVKINYANDNVVVSHKVLIEKDLEKQRTEILNNLERGQVLEGVVKNITNFGAFIDLGGVDGLLHITDISWGRISHPGEKLELDEKVNVVVLDFDDEKKRISLGMKQLHPHPWDSLGEELTSGSRVSGRIVNVADYGAFLEIKPGVEGLIHVSEMSWSQHLRNPQEFLKVEDEVEAVILTIDREERKMSLGIKQLSEDPWTNPEVHQRYAPGTEHTGTVRNLTNYGLFLELEEGIDGLVHVSDLSWTKKIKHPSEFVKVGDQLKVRVLELDIEQRRLALGHKQLEENPWDTFVTIFTPGSVHKGTILNKGEKGAMLELPYGLEGFCSNKHLQKEDDSKAEIGDTLDFKVVEFKRDEQRIILSHLATYKDFSEKKKRSSRTANSDEGDDNEVELPQNQEAKETLSNNDILSDLKRRMEQDQ
ncbi:MAG: 30S ribosomal protein S1 [Bernardetiaceae bacterium]